MKNVNCFFMSKEELIDAILKIDDDGKILEKYCCVLADKRDDLLMQADQIESTISNAASMMEELAMDRAKMKQILETKYGHFIM